MQIMFFRQHFGHLAIGLSNTDERRERHIAFLEETEEFPSDREKFFRITSGGVSHPWSGPYTEGAWSGKNAEVRVAITGTGLWFNPEAECASDNDARIFAKVEYSSDEKYLAFTRPWRTIAWGLKDPVEMSREIISVAIANENTQPSENNDWVVVDKRQVPVEHRSLLGKIMSRVQGAIAQGPDFFSDPKAR